VVSYLVSLVLSLQAFVCSCDSLAFLICSDDVKCETKFLFLDVFLATFLGDRIMLLKLSFCFTSRPTKFICDIFRLEFGSCL
jgi:hypothetical protein